MEPFPRVVPRAHWFVTRCSYAYLGVILLTACAPLTPSPFRISGRAARGSVAAPQPVTRTMPGLVRLFEEALAIVQKQYVEVVPPRALILHALSGVDQRLGPRGVSVVISDETVTIAIRNSISSDSALALRLSESTTTEEGVHAVGSVIDFLNGRARLPLADIGDALLLGLMRADRDGAYLDRETYRELKAAASPNFAGSGADITMRGGAPTIVGSMEGSPAFRAGLQPGDHILKIDGVETKDAQLGDLLRRMRGAPGTKVTFTVARDGWAAPRDIVITREQIPVERVRVDVLGDGIVHLKLRHLGAQTWNELGDILAGHRAQGMSGVILDLRGNRGGLLTAAIEVAEMFLDEDRLIVYTESRVPKENMKFRSAGRKPHTAIPMVALIDRNTSAGSEIVAGALRDWDRALLIGTRTFGRDSIQTIIPLSDGSGLRLT